jgi:hypothetical protein
MFNDVEIGISERVDKAVIWWQSLNEAEKRSLIDKYKISVLDKNTCRATFRDPGGSLCSKLKTTHLLEILYVIR